MEWLRKAACRGMNPTIFFADDGAYYKEAREVCGRCPVAEECLAMILRTPKHCDEVGIFGGLTPTQRRNLPRTYNAYSVPEALL